MPTLLNLAILSFKLSAEYLRVCFQLPRNKSFFEIVIMFEDLGGREEKGKDKEHR